MYCFVISLMRNMQVAKLIELFSVKLVQFILDMFCCYDHCKMQTNTRA